ncbi:hypothetical protein JSY14_07550 [Brachybacterium sp. EF45031]|uniref:hypothetical protein n=1 Tax=Brachybacterium sillae TaxID=2810536 RepID=UPI00217D2942|nr:hypothetical protein [Brachybacterium sillae]MCS6711879.1 hypothetical protein [Brachybacterium sillae]
MTSPSAVSRRTVAKGIAWSAPTVALAVSAPALASSHKKDCYVFDMWSSNGRQPINNHRDQISGTVRYSPNNHQDCIADMNQPYPYDIKITVTLDPSVYTGAFTYSGPGTATGSGNVVTITLPFAGQRPGFSNQWNLYAKTKTKTGVTKEKAKFKAHIKAISYPEAKWKIIEPHNKWMTNRTPSSYDY